MVLDFEIHIQTILSQQMLQQQKMNCSFFYAFPPHFSTKELERLGLEQMRNSDKDAISGNVESMRQNLSRYFVFLCISQFCTWLFDTTKCDLTCGRNFWGNVCCRGYKILIFLFFFYFNFTKGCGKSTT